MNTFESRDIHMNESCHTRLTRYSAEHLDQPPPDREDGDSDDLEDERPDEEVSVASVLHRCCISVASVLHLCLICVAVCCSVLLCVAVCCSVLQLPLVREEGGSDDLENQHVLQYVAVCCSVLLCVAVCCSVLLCVAAATSSRRR